MLTLVTFSCVQLGSKSGAEIYNVSAPEFKDMYAKEGGLLIDIRTPGEYQQGHIEGSLLIDFYAKDYKNNLAKLDTSATVFLYCRSGNRSSKSISTLNNLGFKKIVNLKNGIVGWQRSGYTLVSD